jgi:hypothetical protein
LAILDAYLHLADTHWFGASYIPCSRAQAISANTAVRFAWTGGTFGELQQRLKCEACDVVLRLPPCAPYPVSNERGKVRSLTKIDNRVGRSGHSLHGDDADDGRQQIESNEGYQALGFDH